MIRQTSFSSCASRIISRQHRQLLLAALILLLFPATKSYAFRYGSQYDVIFNAFVSSPDGQDGLEGHVVNNLVLDGQFDALPLNSVVPSDLEGNELRVLELMDFDRMLMMQPGQSETLLFEFDSPSGGALVANPLMSGPFGRVTIALRGLMWEDGSPHEMQLRNPQLRLTGASGVMRIADVPAAIYGRGTLLSPWRVSYSADAAEFGDDTEFVQIALDVFSVPEPNMLVVFAGVLLAATASRRIRMAISWIESSD